MKHTKWILLAEDDAQTAELTALALDAEALAFEVVIVRDGLETLECLHRQGRYCLLEGDHPAAILLDLKMPKLDGLEVLRHIKSDDRLKSIPVVMLTSSREASDVLNSYRLGANAYVVKPVDFGRFTEVLRLVAEFWSSVNEPPPAMPADFSESYRVPAAIAGTS